MPAINLSTHAVEWDELNRKTSNLPILDAYFFIECLRHFGTGKEHLALGYRQHELVAAGIFVQHRSATWATFQPSQAPLGAWLAVPEAEIGALWSGLQRALPSWCLLLGISQQDPKLSHRPADGGCFRTLDYIETACVHIAGNFADYWAQRGRNLRQNLNRQRNRLGRDEIETRLEVIGDPSRTGDAVDDYGRLESQSWKAKKGTALHPDNAQGRFYRAVFEYLAERGEASICRYWYNDDLAATDLCVHRDGVMIILKTTHDENFSKTSPTHLMRQEFFEQLFDGDEIRCVEFYGKLMDWHTKWSDDIRRMYHVNCYRWPLLAGIRGIFSSSVNNR